MYYIETVPAQSPIMIENPDGSTQMSYTDDPSLPPVKRVAGEPGQTMMEIHDGFVNALMSQGQNEVIAHFNAGEVMYEVQYSFPEEERVARANEMVYNALQTIVNTPGDNITYQAEI